MTRALYLSLAALLALATGLGLLGIATTLSQAPLTVAPATTAATAAIQRFYAAADLALRTGNLSALEDTVAPGFVDHATEPNSAAGALGYVRFLFDLRAACADCRLTAQSLATTHDQAAVRVAVRGSHRDTAGEIAFDGSPLTWTSLDVLRIAGGQVAERWSHGDPLSSAASLVADGPDASTAGSAETQIVRFVLPPGASLHPFTTSGPAQLTVEDGTVSLSSDGVMSLDSGYDARLEAVLIEEVLIAGRKHVLAAGLRHHVTNEGPKLAVVLVLATAPLTILPHPNGVAFPP